MATAEPDWFTLEGAPVSRAAFLAVWFLAALTYGVGDVVTTIAIVWFSPLLVEANPLLRVAIEQFGSGALLTLKLLAFYAVLGVSLWAGVLGRDRLMVFVPPLILAVSGALLTVSNLGLLGN